MALWLLNVVFFGSWVIWRFENMKRETGDWMRMTFYGNSMPE